MNKGLHDLIPTISAVLPLEATLSGSRSESASWSGFYVIQQKSTLFASLTRGKHGKTFDHAKTYLYRGVFVRFLPTSTILAVILTMDPPNPTTPDRRFARTKHVLTPNRLATTFATSSQPVGSTQRALQAPLTGSAIFANEAIVGAVFQPSKVKDQTVKDILAEIDDDPSLKAARSAVLHGKLAETKKYGPLVCHHMLSCGWRR